jgi:hypothetical protein
MPSKPLQPARSSGRPSYCSFSIGTYYQTTADPVVRHPNAPRWCPYRMAQRFHRDRRGGIGRPTASDHRHGANTSQANGALGGVERTDVSRVCFGTTPDGEGAFDTRMPTRPSCTCSGCPRGFPLARPRQLPTHPDPSKHCASASIQHLASKARRCKNIITLRIY